MIADAENSKVQRIELCAGKYDDIPPSERCPTINKYLTNTGRNFPYIMFMVFLLLYL